MVQEKLQKHQTFEAEVVANKERIFSAIAMGESQPLSLSSSCLSPFTASCHLYLQL